MKKIIILISIALLSLCLAFFVSCKNTDDDLRPDDTKNIYTITVEKNDYVDVVLSADSVYEGDAVLITFIADEGYSVKTVYINNVDCTKMLDGNVITLSSVNENKTVRVVSVKNSNELPGIK